VVPESSARRNQGALKLAILELTDDWCVRERYALVREGERLPAYAQALLDALVAHFAGRVNGVGAQGPVDGVNGLLGRPVADFPAQTPPLGGRA
jgi:hypothetical protein